MFGTAMIHSLRDYLSCSVTASRRKSLSDRHVMEKFRDHLLRVYQLKQLSNYFRLQAP